MDTPASRLAGAEIGKVFTPPDWAEWLITRWGVCEAWLSGATVCDPTAGEGAFALALMRLARARGADLTAELLSRLMLIELDPQHLRAFKGKARQEFCVDFPETQLLARDVIIHPPAVQFDFLIGNPPWANFTDLPARYKETLKPYFIAEGLVPDKRKVLLGSSRTDLAALVLKVVLGRLLGRNGFGCFYLPLSLFAGEDAHRGFRDYQANRRDFAIDEVWEFTQTRVFHGVGTSYGCARFEMDKRQAFPVRYFRESSSDWIEHRAIPLTATSDPWRILADDESDALPEPIDVALLPTQKPRQGINTCGVNQVFIFDEYPKRLPARFVFPLATKDIWKTGDTAPRRWILLPYDSQTGKPLPWPEIERHPELCRHLIKAKGVLENRAGTLIRASISKGIWWALLGVGPYCFAPYKVIWEAYGKSDFNPTVLHKDSGQVWQANQSMQAFIPCWSEVDAQRVCAGLKHPSIVALLQQLNGDGKCNWAQPGKVKKVLSFHQPKDHQLQLID